MLASGRLEPGAPVLDRGVALVEAQSRQAAHQPRADEAGLGRDGAVEELDRGRVLPHGQTDEPLEVEAVDVAGALRQDALALLERFEEEALLDEGLGQRLARVEVVGLLHRGAPGSRSRALWTRAGADRAGCGGRWRRRRPWAPRAPARAGFRRARPSRAGRPPAQRTRLRRRTRPGPLAGGERTRPRPAPRAGRSAFGLRRPSLARADLFETAQRARRLQLEVPALGLAQLVAVAVAQPRVDLGRVSPRDRRARARGRELRRRRPQRRPRAGALAVPGAAAPPARSRRAGPPPERRDREGTTTSSRSRADLGAHALDVAIEIGIAGCAAARPGRRRRPPRASRGAARPPRSRSAMRTAPAATPASGSSQTTRLKPSRGRLEQHELAVAADEVVEHLLLGVAAREQIAHLRHHRQRGSAGRVGDRHPLAYRAAHALAQRARGGVELGALERPALRRTEDRRFVETGLGGDRRRDR